MWVLRQLSGMVLIIGWMAMVLAAVGVWSYTAIELIMSLGWGAGVAFMVSSLAAFVHFDRYTKAPFVFWLRLWEYGDRMIVDR